MNNKGFAITGILYTLFILFTMILLTILASLSYKRIILEKTITKIGEKYELEKIENLNDSYTNNGTETKANYKGKYIFKLEINNNIVNDNCVIYLNKDQIIQPTNTPSENFVFTPTDCSNYLANIYLTTPETTNQGNKLILTEVYKYKGEH